MTVPGSGSAIASFPDGVLDQLVGHPLDGAPQLLDGPRRERAAHQPSQPGVVGRLDVEHAAADDPPERRVRRRLVRAAHLGVRRDVQVAAAEPPVPQQRVHVGVPAHQPGVGRRVVHDARSAPQHLAGGVDIAGPSAPPATLSTIPGIVVSGADAVTAAGATAGFDDIGTVIRLLSAGADVASAVVTITRATAVDAPAIPAPAPPDTTAPDTTAADPYAVGVPAYDYRCRTCDVRFEVRRAVDEPETPVDCPRGHGATSRVFTAVAVGGRTLTAGEFTLAGDALIARGFARDQRRIAHEALHQGHPACAGLAVLYQRHQRAAADAVRPGGVEHRPRQHHPGLDRERFDAQRPAALGP